MLQSAPQQTSQSQLESRFQSPDQGFDVWSYVAILKRHLGQHRAARTVVCVGLLEPGWLVEIEAVAAAD